MTGAPSSIMRAFSIRTGEGAAAASLATMVFCVSAASISVASVIPRHLAARIPVTAQLAIFGALFVAAAAYGILARRLSRLSLGITFSATTLGLLLIGAASAWGADFISTPVLALSIGALLPRSFLALLWLHATSIAVEVLDRESGLRLLPLVGAGSAIGAFAGRASVLAVEHRWGVAGGYLLAAAFLSVGLGVSIVGERRWQAASSSTQQERDDETAERVPWGYLVAITLLVLVVDVVRDGAEELWKAQFSAQGWGGSLHAQSRSLVRLVGGSIAIVLMLFALARFFRAAGVTVALLGLLAACAVWLLPLAVFGAPVPQPWSWAPVVAAGFVTPLAVAPLVLLLPLPRGPKYGPRVVLALLAGGLDALLSASVVGRVIELMPPRGAACVVLALCAMGVPLAVYLGRRFESLAREARANVAAGREPRDLHAGAPPAAP